MSKSGWGKRPSYSPSAYGGSSRKGWSSVSSKYDDMAKRFDWSAWGLGKALDRKMRSGNFGLEVTETQTKRVQHIMEVLVKRSPFLGVISSQMRILIGEVGGHDISTDGVNLIINPDNLSGYDDGHLLNAMAHAAAHVAAGHAYRMGSRDSDRWNTACDLAVEHSLRKMGFGPAPGVMTAAGIGFDKPITDKTSEEIYRMLQSQNSRNRPSGGGVVSPTQTGDLEPAPGQGKPDKEGDGDGDKSASEARREAEEQAREMVAKAELNARKAGKFDGNCITLIDDSLESMMDWKDELRKFLGGGDQIDQTWARPNRRMMAHGHYIPGAGRFGPGEVVLAVDVSGSINRELLEKFMAEIRKLNEDMAPDAIHIMTCDASVRWKERFGTHDDLTIPPKAITGGGTRFSPVFDRVREEGIPAKALVYFTDLECSDFGKQPDFPVLWIVWPGGRTTAPWGTVIEMQD